MVRSLGADHTINYTQTDITQAGQYFDLILDAAAYRSVFDYLPILSAKGTYVLVDRYPDWMTTISRTPSNNMNPDIEAQIRVCEARLSAAMLDSDVAALDVRTGEPL
jgi:D-arabinose 1-dehydrogenase-like Zn-dependent alcohol dehydrogenase